MKGAFASIARMAIEEMVLRHAKESKYGYFLSPSDVRELVINISDFLETSRNLKSAGDRILLDPPTAPIRDPKRRPRQDL